METQKFVRLSLSRNEGESKSVHPHTQTAFNRFGQPFENGHVPIDVLLARLLKRQAAAVMRDVTTCPPDTIPAHIQRLDGLREVLRFAIAHGLVPPPERRISGAQLTCPCTCQDFIESLEITRRQHRAPSLATMPHDQLERIERKIETIAACLAGGDYV